jgi:4'-phosphopantetheinyl transferase
MNRNPECEIHPVILKVPPGYGELPVRERVRFLSRFGRRAVSESAARAGYRLTSFPKDENGAPLAVDGIHWSLTHKPGYVAGVAAPGPIGIDIEEIRPRSERLKDRIAGPEEWELIDSEAPESFFRFWTAKEAVLKAAGVGLTALFQCTIRQVIDFRCLAVSYKGKTWTVAHFFFDGHIAAVIQDRCRIHWKVLNEIEPDPAG